MKRIYLSKREINFLKRCAIEGITPHENLKNRLIKFGCGELSIAEILIKINKQNGSNKN